VLNTRTMAAASAVELLAVLTGRPEFQPTGDSQAILRDLALASQVEAVLMHDPQIWAEHLRVSVRGGAGTGSGQGLTEDDLDLAGAAARGVGGLQTVHNEIAARPPPLASM